MRGTSHKCLPELREEAPSGTAESCRPACWGQEAAFYKQTRSRRKCVFKTLVFLKIETVPRECGEAGSAGKGTWKVRLVRQPFICPRSALMARRGLFSGNCELPLSERGGTCHCVTVVGTGRPERSVRGFLKVRPPHTGHRSGRKEVREHLKGSTCCVGVCPAPSRAGSRKEKQDPGLEASMQTLWPAFPAVATLHCHTPVRTCARPRPLVYYR